VKRKSVLLADDHALLAETIRMAIETHFDVVGIAPNGKAMVEMAHQYRPDVVIADISMPLLNGIDAVRIVRKELGGTRILILTMYADAYIIEEAFRAGVDGFITKRSGLDELLQAVQTVSMGRPYITPLVGEELISVLSAGNFQEGSSDQSLTLRQRQTLQLLAEGKTMKEAAAIMSISTRTAESHKYEIMRRLSVNTTADLVRYAVRMKLV